MLLLPYYAQHPKLLSLRGGCRPQRPLATRGDHNRRRPAAFTPALDGRGCLWVRLCGAGGPGQPTQALGIARFGSAQQHQHTDSDAAARDRRRREQSAVRRPFRAGPHPEQLPRAAAQKSNARNHPNRLDGPQIDRNKRKFDPKAVKAAAAHVAIRAIRRRKRQRPHPSFASLLSLSLRRAGAAGRAAEDKGGWLLPWDLWGPKSRFAPRSTRGSGAANRSLYGPCGRGWGPPGSKASLGGQTRLARRRPKGYCLQGRLRPAFARRRRFRASGQEFRQSGR